MVAAKPSLQTSAPNQTAPRGLRQADHREITDFIETCQSAGKTTKTLQTYKEGALQLAAFTAEQGMPLLEALTREHLEAFFGSLRARGNKPATVANRHRAARALFNWMVDEDLRKDHPMERIKPPKVPDQVQPHYTDEEIGLLLKSLPEKVNSAREADRLALRDRAIILFLLDTGLRCQELCDLRFTDVTTDERTFHVVKGKAGKGRLGKYSADVATALKRYMRSRGGWPNREDDNYAVRLREPLFAMRGGVALTVNGVRNMMIRRFAVAGVEFRGTHAFRRSFGIAYLENGGDPLDLKELAGWSSWSMLHKYTKATATSRALRAHEEFSPVARMMQKGRKR